MGYYITVGYFDGVHCGHQKLLKNMVQEGQKGGFKTKVITFLERPKDFFRGVSTPSLLTGEMKIKKIKGLGIDEVMVYSLKEIKDMSGIEFLDFLIQKHGMKGLFVTDKLLLGCDQLGFEALCGYLKQKAVLCYHIPLSLKGNEAISTTLIRHYLYAGEVEEIAPILGEFYSIEGVVGHGDKKGREIGFPTLNIELKHNLFLPKEASYITLCSVDAKRIPSMTFLGTSFVKEEPKFTMETHLINFEGDLYGKAIRLYFLKFLRNNERFTSMEELKKKLYVDREKCLWFFEKEIPNLGIFTE